MTEAPEISTKEHENQLRGFKRSERARAALLNVLEDERMAKSALAASESELRALFASMQDLVLVVDRDGVVHKVASSDPALLSMKPEELKGKKLQSIFSSDQAVSSLEVIGNALDTRNTQQFEYSVIIEGQPLWFSALITAMTENEVLWVARNVTEKKLSDQQREEWIAKVERSNRELEEFAYVASHDLQEPLRMVTSYLELLQRRYGSGLEADAQEFVGFAVDGAQRMQVLIRDLLTLSRVETRGQELKPVSSEDVLERTLHNLQIALHDAQATVTHDELPMVLADEGQLAQLLQNMIGNAIKFRGEDQPKVHISAKAQDDLWQFSVQDNGIGIDPQYHDRIFEIFQRLHGRDEYEGTGIGLAICKRIVERHGGTIWLESSPGQGTTFWFTLRSV